MFDGSNLAKSRRRRKAFLPERDWGGNKAQNETDMIRIMLPYGEGGRLATELNVSYVCVWKALTGKSDTPLARMIRKAAIERGGAEYDPNRRKRTN